MAGNIPDTLQDYFRKRGIKTKSDTREPTLFVGKKAATTFSAMEDRQAARFTSTTDVAVLGEAYTSLVYENGRNQERVYEDIYGANDFTVPVQQNQTSKAVLSEVFGDNDSDPTGEASGLGEAGLKTSLGRTGAVKYVLRGLIENHNSLYEAQTNTAGYRDEDASGVRGVEDLGSAIEPIA